MRERSGCSGLVLKERGAVGLLPAAGGKKKSKAWRGPAASSFWG